MMPRTGELYTRRVADFEISQGEPPLDVLEERLDFVRGMRWLDNSDDTDRYDLRDDTYHFVQRDDSGAVIAAMRLTAVDSVEDSLSYEMLAANEQFQAAVREGSNGEVDGELWDLTRLIFPLENRHDSETVKGAIVQLFGMAARVSAGRDILSEQDVTWIFTTTPWMLRFLNQTGVQSKVLASDRLPDVDGKLNTTLFCKVDVASAIETLRVSEKHRDTFRLLLKGVAEAEVEVGRA